MLRTSQQYTGHISVTPRAHHRHTLHTSQSHIEHITDIRCTHLSHTSSASHQHVEQISDCASFTRGTRVTDSQSAGSCTRNPYQRRFASSMLLQIDSDFREIGEQIHLKGRVLPPHCCMKFLKRWIFDHNDVAGRKPRRNKSLPQGCAALCNLPA